MIRSLLILIVAMCSTFATLAFDPKVDLDGSRAVASGECPYEEQVFLCFVVKKDEKLYLALVDEKGIVLVYSIKEIKKEYCEGDTSVVWVRRERRQNDST